MWGRRALFDSIGPIVNLAQDAKAFQRSASCAVLKKKIEKCPVTEHLKPLSPISVQGLVN
jgi:hypothetical protein